MKDTAPVVIGGRIAGNAALFDDGVAATDKQSAVNGKPAPGVVAGNPVVGNGGVADVQGPAAVADSAAFPCGLVVGYPAVGDAQLTVLVVDSPAARFGLIALNDAVGDAGL